jgi:hypothetical protein
MRLEEEALVFWRTVLEDGVQVRVSLVPMVRFALKLLQVGPYVFGPWTPI